MKDRAIGSRIRRLRRRMGWTLQQVGDQCGFTRSLLSKIETGKTVPPVATLTRIAAALGAPVSAFLDDAQDHGTVVERASGHRPPAMTRTDKGYRFFAFAARRPGKLMQPLLFEARRGGVRNQALSHSGEEFVFVLEGKMKYRVGNTEYLLGPGDSLYFDAEQEHELQPVSQTVRYLAVFTESGKSPHRKRGS